MAQHQAVLEQYDIAEIAASDDSRDSGGWSNEELENDEQHEAYNLEMRQRRDLMQYRLANNDWCQCDRCVPPGFAASAYDLTCCREIAAAVAVCNEGVPPNIIPPNRQPLVCITQNPGFYFYCINPRHLENSYRLYKVIKYVTHMLYKLRCRNKLQSL